MDEIDNAEPVLPDAREDIVRARQVPDTPQTRSPSYRLAYTDMDFMVREELRPVRLQLELLKPELELAERRVESTIVVFGSARVPDPEVLATALDDAERAAAAAPEDAELAAAASALRRQMARARYYGEARRFAALATAAGQHARYRHMVIVTGGGPGVMEAANRGAADVGGVSIGLNIVLPHEQAPNPYVTPELCFQFHYFALRKMHFLLRARALVVFPGGYGTLDELFETLCLIQTGKIRPIPVLLFDRAYWERLVNFELMVDEGMIARADLSLFRFVESAEDAWGEIARHYGLDQVDP